MDGIWPGCPRSMCTWLVMPAYVCGVSPIRVECLAPRAWGDYSEIISYMS